MPATDWGSVSRFCRHAIEAHGGRIWAENNPDQGSRFLFRLPIQQLASSTSSTSSAAGSSLRVSIHFRRSHGKIGRRNRQTHRT